MDRKDQTVAGRQRIVILGGGPAGVAAAYWLSAPEQKERYAITLYTQGWRLGGKCASGRNSKKDARIEEHGLHMLMGCYQNAFATLRSCYADWRATKADPANPFQRWSDAFLPQRLISLMEQDGPGSPPSWSPWNFRFPRRAGEPGDELLPPGALQDGNAPSDDGLIFQMASWLSDNLPDQAPFAPSLRLALHKLKEVLRGLARDDASAQTALLQASASIHETLNRARQIASGTDPTSYSIASRALDRYAILADLGVAIAYGYLRDIWGRGPAAYDALNGLDLREWLRTRHASHAAIQSAPIRGFYDLVFAYTTAEPKGGSMATGAALRAVLEILFGYHNAPLFKMAAGTGDAIFTPFYDVLTGRGVTIEFFSQVTALRPSGTSKLGEIDIRLQAATVSGGPYRPLIRVKELDCWPNQPLWKQLVDGDSLEAKGVCFESSACTVSVGMTTLRAGADFDVAITALPPDALKPIATDLTSSSSAWQQALSQSASAWTQALQLWMKPNLADLGWRYGSTVLTAFAEPYDSWGDMSQVIACEDWNVGSEPGSVGYFCGRLEGYEGPIDPAAIDAAATHAADAWLDEYLAILWPDVGAHPVQRGLALDRFGRANFDLSERYVLTPAGDNVASRFDPAKPAGFGNLYAIGDWTKTRFSGGCFESAIESAMLASCAISGFPRCMESNTASLSGK